jgi:cellobiose-specific phosphotransferase system component IIA
LLSSLWLFNTICYPNQDQARIATKNLVTKGQTNLSGGLLQAMNMLRTNKTGNDVSAVLLFTDGLANMGITKTPGIVKAVDGIVKQIETVCSVFTFGYGSDPDPEFLKAISDQANGMFYFMKSPESIPESFADCLGGLLSVVAQNICLTIEAGKHSTISEVTTIYRTVVEQPGKIVKIYIGDLYSEERKDILCTIELESLTEAKEKDSVLEIQCNYRNVISAQSEFLKTTAVIDRPDTVIGSVPINGYVDKQRNRIIAAKAMEQALEEGKKEDYNKAQELLENAKQVIVQSSSRNDAYCQLLVRQLEDSKSEVKTKEQFHGHGKQFLSSTVTSHYQQRANIATEGYYSSKSKSVVKEGYKQMVSAPSVYQEKKDPGSNHNSNSNSANNNSNNNN